MKRLENMKESLISCVQAEINGGLHEVDTKELGEAIDMIKDLEEAIYYCTITKAMNESEEDEHDDHKYYPYYRDMDRKMGKMYYPGGPVRYDRYGFRMEDMRYPHEYMMYGGNGASNGNGSRGYDTNYPTELRDHREGRSPMSRRSYMESKEMNKDAKVKMHELEKYMQELTQDVVEMIEGATPEEKQVLQQKINLLATKIK